MNVGIDIIEIERVARAARNESFLHGVFCEAELHYYRAHGEKAQTLAGMFCAKEAVVKALGVGFEVRPSDVEIAHGEKGQPTVILKGGALNKFPNADLRVSISHCETYAAATAVLL